MGKEGKVDASTAAAPTARLAPKAGKGDYKFFSAAQNAVELALP